ncbi:uncharacterized protein [Centruroides vittatus]
MKCANVVYLLFSMLVFVTLTLATAKLPKTMQRIRPILELLFFYEAKLSNKMKIISYRKRLGNFPIGITVANVFTVTKESIPKICHTMYSCFTSLLNVKHEIDACKQVYEQFSI